MRKRVFQSILLLAVFWTGVYGAVNPNTATVEQLDGLRGVGPKLAQAIVADREANGPFANVGALCRVKGVRHAKLAQMIGADSNGDGKINADDLDAQTASDCSKNSPNSSGTVYSVLGLASSPQ